tara:strand:+ start:133 stop:486 length:354 start_codon:yes stop_codon:yes gene_type:complete
MNVKYTKKMEDMISTRYRRSTSLQINTAKDILRDFKRMFSEEALKNMTAARIRSKFQTMQTLRRDKPALVKTPLKNWTPELSKPKNTTLKDSMFEVMRKSDNMTITIKGTEITVVFK